jgi:hypothetical protein
MWEQLGAAPSPFTSLSMLPQETLERVLNIYNEVVPEHRLTLGELLLHVRQGTIGPPDVLDDVNQLLKTLFRYGYEQRAAKFPVAPPAWAKRHTRFLWTIWEWPPAPSPRPQWARMIAEDPCTGTCLIATMHHEPITYSSEDLFNDFLALDLQSMPTSFYPDPQDRQKMVAFLARYGSDFLPYPCPDRSAEDQLDYFSEFNRQYQTFAHAVRNLAAQPLPPPVFPEGPGGSTTYDPVDNALTNLNHGLDQIKPRLRRLPDGTIVTTFESTYGLHLCYATLWEAMNSSQPPFSFCALPSCRRPFIRQRKDQTCCTTAHATARRQQQHRHTL